MKRKILTAVALMLCALMMALSFSGCSRTFTCELCGRTVTGRSHMVTILGEKARVCDECYQGIKELQSMFS